MKIQQKYNTKKYAAAHANSNMTTFRYDQETAKKLKDLQLKSGLSQSQILRKLIHNEHIIQNDLRMEIFSYRDKLNHLGKISTRPEDRQTLCSLEKEYSALKAKFMGGE